jgi:hypothetical protein
MAFLPLDIECTECEYINSERVSFLSPALYTGTILKTIWCQGCGSLQVLRYKFTCNEGTQSKGTEITKRIPASQVYVPKAPETGITIRPRAGKPRHK